MAPNTDHEQREKPAVACHQKSNASSILKRLVSTVPKAAGVLDETRSYAVKKLLVARHIPSSRNKSKRGITAHNTWHKYVGGIKMVYDDGDTPSTSSSSSGS